MLREEHNLTGDSFQSSSSRNRVKREDIIDGREDILNDDTENIDDDAPDHFLPSSMSAKKLAWLLHSLADVADKYDKLVVNTF